MPILHTLCNPGLRERHWQQIAVANGVDIKRGDDTSLHDMIEAGLNRSGHLLKFYSVDYSRLFLDILKKTQGQKTQGSRKTQGIFPKTQGIFQKLKFSPTPKF